MFERFFWKKEQVEKFEREAEKVKPESKVKDMKPIRAVFHGFLYDTSKAEKIIDYFAEDDSMAVGGMYYGIEATLYRTKNGRFFIVQCGRVFPCGGIEVANILRNEPEMYQEILGGVDEA